MAFIANVKDSTFIAHKKRHRGLAYAVSLSLLLLLVLSSIYVFLHGQVHEKREKAQYDELATMQAKVIEEINSVGADLVYFAHSELALATLSSQDRTAKNFLTSLMIKIGALHQRYDQLRLLDVNGNEVIRLNHNEAKVMQPVPSPQLQNKSQRYYFKESKKLPPQQLYVSSFDLNMEQGKVERPLKPMLRFGAPVHDESGELIGVGILNYQGERIHHLIDTLNAHAGDLVFLLNEQGYYLKSPYPDSEWGFMLPERGHHQFQARHSKIWEEIQQHSIGDATSNEGEFYFSSFELLPSSPIQANRGEKVTLIMHVPHSIIHQDAMVLIQGLGIAFLLLAPLLSFLGWSLGKFQVKQAWLFQKLAFEARHDSLTGLYNRKAIMEFFRHNILISNRRASTISISFIDVNDLKLMNDKHGHDMGDELIKGVAQSIRKVIRASDAAARIGGDEFLIVFVDCDANGAQNIMERIECMFTRQGEHHAGLPWSLSFGCATLQGENDTAEKMIERADVQMYRHKQHQKELKAS